MYKTLKNLNKKKNLLNLSDINDRNLTDRKFKYYYVHDIEVSKQLPLKNNILIMKIADIDYTSFKDFLKLKYNIDHNIVETEHHIEIKSI